MQPIVMPLVALALMASVDTPAPESGAIAGPEATIREISPFVPPGKQCRDGATPTNDRVGRQPRLERGPATPGMGQTIYAVDRRVDGCPVILVKGASVQPLGGTQLSPEDREQIKPRR